MFSLADLAREARDDNRHARDYAARGCSPRGGHVLDSMHTGSFGGIGRPYDAPPRPDHAEEGSGSVVAKKDGAKHEGAAELLAAWRAAERDTAAAGSSAKIAALALQAATSAEEAASEVEAAANAAAEAVERARSAALRARKAAEQAAEAAQLALVTAEGDTVRANLDVEKAQKAEDHARDEFHEAQEHDFE